MINEKHLTASTRSSGREDATNPTFGALALPEGVVREDRADGWLVLTYPQSRVSTGALLAAVQAAGVEIADLATAEADLEDAFLALTRG